MPSSRSSERPSSSRSRGRGRSLDPGPVNRTSIVRTGLAVLLVVLGIAWLVMYLAGADPLTQLKDLGKWNFVIGFGAVFAGLALAAHPSTPMGRGRGVVVGMLGCFLIGLVWIVLYYVTGQSLTLPLITDLGQYNLVVGIGFMAVGFVYATHWE